MMNLANPVEGFDYQIVVDTISGDNAGKTPLIDQVQSKTIKVKMQMVMKLIISCII